MRFYCLFLALLFVGAVTAFPVMAQEGSGQQKSKPCNYKAEDGSYYEYVAGTVVSSDIMYPKLKCKDDDCTELWKAVSGTRLVEMDRVMPDGSVHRAIAHPPHVLISEMREGESPFLVGERYSFCAFKRKYKDPFQQKVFGERLNIDMKTVKRHGTQTPTTVEEAGGDMVDTDTVDKSPE